ncbi:MAG: efflux RND transporter permease subunit, partial [Pseudomonadota bacterium]
TIRQGFEDGQSQGLKDGKPAIQITVERAQSADTLKTAKILDDYLSEIDGGLPPGIELQKYEVRADSLVERISLLFWNGITGLVLVVATLFLFLNARIAFWVAAGIPVAMFATLGIMLLLGQTVNMITLFAMIMMLGIIVDDAIVVGEHTASRFEAGDGAFEAAENGAKRMLTPVMAAMITTIAAFAPMLLISGIIGQIMGVMPYVVIAVIIASLIECFLILPGHLAHTLEEKPIRQWSFWRQMLCALIIGGILVAVSNRFSEGGSGLEGFGLFDLLLASKADFSTPIFLLLVTFFSLLVGTVFELVFWAFNKFGPERASIKEGGKFRKWFDRNFNAFRDGPFNWLVSLSYRWRYVTIAVTGACILILAIAPIRGEHVKFVFFPSPEAENVRAGIVFNAGIVEDQAKQAILEIEAALDRAVAEFSDDPDDIVTAVFTTLGSAGFNVGDNLAEIRVQLASSEVRTVRTPEVVKAWRKQLPKIAGTRRIAIYETRGGPPGRDVDIELTGGDAFELKQAATAVIPIVSAIDGVSGVADDLPFGKPELVMELKPRGAALGFTMEDVGRQVRQAFDGAVP